ncbi:MAG: ABC transporter permease [Spirochaetia bacterium]
MRKIGAMLLKDGMIYFTSPMQWLFFLILPVVFSLLLGLAGKRMEKQNPMDLGIVDYNGTGISKNFIGALEETGAFNIIMMDNREGAEKSYRSGGVSGYLVIPDDFSKQMEQGQNPEVAYYGNQTQNTVVSIINFALSASSLAYNTAVISSETAGAGPESSLFMNVREQAESAVRGTAVETQAVGAGKEVSNTASLQVIGQLITWALINMLVASSYLVLERERGTYQRLLISPVKGRTFLIGAGMFQFLAGLLQMFLLILFGTVVMGIPWTRSIPGLLIVLVPFAAAAVSLGLLLAAFAKTSGQADSLSTLFGMGMALLGGCWYPLVLFPDTARKAAHVLPTTWTLEGLIDLVLRGKPAEDVILHGLVLLGFAVVFYSAAWLKFSVSRNSL